MDNVTDIKSPVQRQRDFLHNYPDKFLACRDRHDWPALVPGKQPRRTRLIPWADEVAQGSYLLEQTCGNCTRTRWRVTGPHGVGYSAASGWHYRDPKGYAAPKGMGLTRGQFLDELYRRVVEQFEAQQQAPVRA